MNNIINKYIKNINKYLNITNIYLGEFFGDLLYDLPKNWKYKNIK